MNGSGFPDTADFLNERIVAFSEQSPLLGKFADELHSKMGTRLIDWVDHLELNWSSQREETLNELG